MSAEHQSALKSLESDEFLEQLASIEHERWSHWQRYLHSQCLKGDDGALTIPTELVQRWEVQMNTPYESLSETEQKSDRDQVRRYLPLIVEVLKQQQ